MPYFAVFMDNAGNKHRVHKVCLDDAQEADRILTANQSAYHGDIDGDFDYY